MRFAFLKLLVLVFALLALPSQALGAAGPGGCAGGADAAVSVAHGDGADGHHDGEEGNHAPLCGACPTAATVVPGAQAEAGAIAFDDAPVRYTLHSFASVTPEPDKRPPLASA